MTTYLPTIKQLQYLVALHDFGHFGKAAESCFVTQSTLSASLRELEALVGVTLVERTRRVLRFTPLGVRITDQARRVLREAEELADMARADGLPLTGDLRMAVIPTIAPFLLPTMLPGLRRAWPDLRLYLREEPSQAACDALHRGQLDCVLLALPFDCGDVDMALLFDDPLHVASPASERRDPAKLASGEIGADRLLLLEDGHCLKDHALAACGGATVRSGATMIGTSLHTLVQMVDNGLGITFLPDMAVRAGILEGTAIRLTRLETEHGSRQIALAWRRASPRADEYQLLAAALRESHAAMMGKPHAPRPPD